MLAEFCEENSCVHDKLLFYSEVRWLSCGQSLTRLIELRRPITKLLMKLAKKKKPSAALQAILNIWNDDFIKRVYFISQYATTVNYYNLSLQEKHLTLVDAKTIITKLKAKIALMKANLTQSPYFNFCKTQIGNFFVIKTSNLYL